MKEGDLVRHTALANWGTGVVVGCDQTGFDINFDLVGRKRIVRDQAPIRLAPVLRTEVAADSALLVPTAWKLLELPPGKRAAPRSKARRVCEHCEKLLTTSQYRDRRRQKSCPRCSANDGRQHVFLPYPEAFAPADEPADPTTPAGAVGDCSACRADLAPTFAQTRCAGAAVVAAAPLDS